MRENDNQTQSGMLEENSKWQNDEMKKTIEEIEEKAFMAGYDYAIEVLKTGRVQKK